MNRLNSKLISCAISDDFILKGTDLQVNLLWRTKNETTQAVSGQPLAALKILLNDQGP